MPEIKANFSKGLSYLLKRHHINQAQLAREIGISPASLTDYKMGRRKGDEKERNRIANKLGFPEHIVRSLGALIRTGVPEEEAYERVCEQGSSNDGSDENAMFNRCLDVLFAQIKEFLRDGYGENLHVAMAFERIFSQRFPIFDAWKEKLLTELLEPPTHDEDHLPECVRTSTQQPTLEGTP